MNELKFCQSCGMPLDSSQVMGTNGDGSVNDEYCIYCFKDGAFTQDVGMEEMIDISVAHVKELFKNDLTFSEEEVRAKMNGFFPRLKRWS